MKTILSLIILALLPAIGYSQSNELENEQVVTKVSANKVSSTITVHTYSFNNEGLSSAEGLDMDGELEYSEEVQSIVDQFLSVSGISRCTFDKATNTFTILSTPETQLSEIVDIINKK